MGVDHRKGPTGTAFGRNCCVAKDGGMATRDNTCLSGCSCSSKLSIELGLSGCHYGTLWCVVYGNPETTEGCVGKADDSLRRPEKELLGGSPIMSPSSP